MSANAYNSQSAGDLITSSKFNEVTAALGRVTDVGLYPDVMPDYVLWRSGATYYAKNSHTGAVTSNAACHTLANGLLATDTWLHFKGSSLDYDLTGAINFANYTDAVITGNPRRGTVFKPADTINAFEFDENWWCVLDGFKIDGASQTTAGMGLKFTEATGTNYAKHNVIKNIEFSGCYVGIGDAWAGTNEGAVNLFKDLKFFDSNHTDIRFHVNGTGGWTFNNCYHDHIAVQATDDWLFRMVGADGVSLVGCSFLTGGASSKHTALFDTCDFIYMDRVDAEKAGLSIFKFEDCTIANISNIRAAESNMSGGAAGDANFFLQGCRDFNVSNFFFGTTTATGAVPLKIVIDGATESTRCKFVNGNISGSAAGGNYIANSSTYIKFNNVDFFSNTGKDVTENGTPNFNTYKNCSFQSGNGNDFLGANNIYDQFITSASSMDLSGGATDEDIFYAQGPCLLAGYKLFYTEASSADVDWPVEAIRIGRTQDGVANDPDYFDEITSEASKAIGYTRHVSSTTLTNQVIAADDTVTVGTAGGKTGTGEIRVILQIIENSA